MITIILVRPRNPNNIGAAARAIANFGISDLRLVNTHPPVLEEAVSAVGAEKILKKAKVFDSLSSAVKDCNFVYATTSLKNRNIEKEIIFLPDLKLPRGKTAVVFGPEKTGLGNEDIALCDAVLNIPSAAAQPSINLAQAVTLVCYEISKQHKFKKLKIKTDREIPSKEDVEIVVKTASKYFKDTAAAREILACANLTRGQLFAVKKFLKVIDQP
ncbi:MAG: RNA methyltransferase [Elusimicrobium sp.]|jgi:tRNA/rRNA methyltransferase|nr:RNA methyltransferase [Elusimicrobium sp.]